VGGEEEGGGVVGEAAGGEALLGARQGVVPARARCVAIYAAHLWARSWCPSPASAGQDGDGQGLGEAEGGQEESAASALGGAGVESASKGSVDRAGQGGVPGGVSVSNQETETVFKP